MSNTVTPEQPRIILGTHPKLNRLFASQDEKKRMNALTDHGWRRAEMSLDQLAAQLDTGASAAAEFTDGHRCTDSARAQFIALDIDHGDPERQQLEGIADTLNCAYISGETGSSAPGDRRYRLIIPLAEQIADAELFRQLADRLSFKFSTCAEIDSNSLKIGQPWFGYKRGTTRAHPGAFLTPAAIMALPARPEPEKPVLQRRELPTVATGVTVNWDQERSLWIAQEVMAALDRAAPVEAGRGKYQYRHCPNPAHSDKHPSFRVSYDKSADGIGVCSCGSHAMGQIAEWVNARDFKTWFKDERAALYPAPKRTFTPIGTPSADAPEQPAPDGEHVINERYITRLPATAAPVFAVASDVGTGKTTLAIQTMRTANTAIYVAHREKLADNFTRAAEAAGVVVEHYKSLSRADRRRPSKIAFCINSYADLCHDAAGLPTADLLILDEIAQQLEHIYGDAGTFDGQEAIFAAESLKYAIAQFNQVLALDAHLDSVALDYLRAVRGDQAVETVVNSYTVDRGTLVMHDKRSGALAMGEKLIAENAGVVVYAFASVERAQTAAADLIQRLDNADDVLLLTAENADGERQSAFIRDPNGQIGNYRAVLYSPVLGTGFDITAPVRAVIGIMGGRHLSAFDARQMIGRCRNTRETHVYLPRRGGTLEESADAIYQLELDKAQGTRRKLFIDGVIGKDDSAAWEQQLNYLYWHARVIARRNWSLNHLRDHFIELATGYTVTSAANDDPELDERHAAIKAALDEQRKELALTVAPVDRDTFQRLKEAGRVDQTAVAGNLRWKIESLIGDTITPELRDQLWTDGQRKAVRRYTDLLDNVALLKLADAKEDAEGVPIPRRAHRTKRRNVAVAVLNQLVGANGVTLEIDRAEFEQRLNPVIDKYREDLRYFGMRMDRIPTETAAIVRAILRAHFGGSGLTLHSQQRTVGGEKVRLYQLDQAALDVLITLAARRLRMLERARLEGSNNLNFAKQPLYRGNGNLEIDRQRREPPAQAPPLEWLKPLNVSVLDAVLG